MPASQGVAGNSFERQGLTLIPTIRHKNAAKSSRSSDFYKRTPLVRERIPLCRLRRATPLLKKLRLWNRQGIRFPTFLPSR